MSFTESLQQIHKTLFKEENKVQALCVVLNQYGISLKTSDIVRREGIVYITTTPLKKKQLYLYKKEILTQLQKTDPTIHDFF